MKKFKDLTENDNIETIASVLKNELDEYNKEYKSMMEDGVIDEDELKRVITTMKDLETKARSLSEKMSNENEKAIMEEIINIINTEQVNMKNARDTQVEESQKEL